jgi:hypothetical protein
MNSARRVLFAVAAAAASAALVPAQAAAASYPGQRCAQTPNVRFCAYVIRNPDLYQPTVRIKDRTRSRAVSVRVVATTVFRKVNGTWRVKSTFSTPHVKFQRGSHAHGHGDWCSNWRTGRYKIHGAVEWKVGDNVYRRGIKSRPVRLRRC